MRDVGKFSFFLLVWVWIRLFPTEANDGVKLSTLFRFNKFFFYSEMRSIASTLLESCSISVVHGVGGIKQQTSKA